jgi:hypothetical protein
MTGNETGQARDNHGAERWDQIGRAAEHFARRMARDAGRLAERLEGNATDFAREVSRESRRAARRHHRWHHRRRHHHGLAPGEADVRRTFEDVRGILNDVLDGIDDLIGRLFPDRDETETPPSDAPATDQRSGEWQVIVANKEAACGYCERTIEAGEEVDVRTSEGARELRCSECRPPAGTPGSNS